MTRVGIIIPNHTSWLVIFFISTITTVQLMAKFSHALLHEFTTKVQYNIVPSIDKTLEYSL